MVGEWIVGKHAKRGDTSTCSSCQIKSLFSCNKYCVLGQSAQPLQCVQLVSAGTRDF